MKLKSRASWSAATCRRLFRLADLSARPRRVQRRDDCSGTGFQPVWWWRRTRKQPPTGKVFPPDRLKACPTAEAGNSKTGSERQIVDGDKSPAESGDKSPHSRSAFSFIELLVILCVLALFVFALAPRMMEAKQKAKRIRCVSHLKQIGLSFRLWAGDNGGKYPMAQSVVHTNGGSLEFSNQVWRTFQIMSNELCTPLILTCPADIRSPATSFAKLGNTNISYFIGLDADESMPQNLLSGDHHLSNGRPTTNKVLTIQTNDVTRWSGSNHQGAGNFAISDGSVQQATSARLHQSVTIALQIDLETRTNATLRLAMPE